MSMDIDVIGREVGLRDGLQIHPTFMPTERKLEWIRAEAAAIESGAADPLDNPLKRAPHTLAVVTADSWERPYSRSQAAFPAGPQQRENKFWPAVSRIDNAYGDRHLVCTCPTVEELAS